MSLGNKFACMGYAPEDGVRLPRALKNWYLKNFGACVKDERIICGAPGIYLQLPLTECQAFENSELTEFLTRRAVNELRAVGAGILIPPEKFPVDFPEGLRLADGKKVFALLIMSAIKKALDRQGKNLKKAEILIIDGERSLTECLIENIYPHVNFLYLITDGDYSQTAARIFDDCGLNLYVTGKNRQILESADVVVNTSSGGASYDYYFKRGAAYFELGKNEEKFVELMRKRQDILAADDILVFAANTRVKTKELEAAFYSICGEYRRFLIRGFERETGIGERLKEMAPQVAGLICRGRIF